MKRRCLLGATCWLMLAGLVPLAGAGIPELISYQGVLTLADGTVVSDGLYELRFSVWTAASPGGTEEYSQTLTVDVRDGLYNVILSNAGQGTLLEAFDPEGGPRYVQVEILSGPSVTQPVTLTPRQQVASVPYALSASTAETVETNQLTSRNHLRNGGFDAGTVADSTSAGWTAQDTPTLALAMAAFSEGRGLELNITSSGTATGGITQTLSKLKAGQLYAFGGSFKAADQSSDWTIVTTGAGTNLSLTLNGTADGTSYVRKTGTFVVDAVGSDVVLKVASTWDGASVAVDNFSVIELDLTNRGTQSDRIVESVTQLGAGDPLGASFADWTISPGVVMEVDVQVPGPGYYIKATASVCGVTTSERDLATARLMEEENSEGELMRAQFVSGTEQNGAGVGLSLAYVNLSPTPGAVYNYTVQGSVTQGELTPGGANCGASNGLNSSQLFVEVIPYGS